MNKITLQLHYITLPLHIIIITLHKYNYITYITIILHTLQVHYIYYN